MQKMNEGSKAVLLVVDVQVGVMGNVWESSRVIENIKTVVEKARSQTVPVIWVQHEEEGELEHGSPEWEIVPRLQPFEGEYRVYKSFNSAFENTALEAILHELGANHICLTGAATNWCIRATAYAALDKGFHLSLVKDAHTTEDMEFEDGVIVPAEHIIRDLNVAMSWLTYPGRTCKAILSEEVDFS